MSGRNGEEPEDWICYPDKWISDSSKDVDLRSPPSVVSIFRVPNVLMEDSEKREAYVPTRVSLGPYHNRTAELRPMDIHKRRALHRIISRRFNNVRNLPDDPNPMCIHRIRALPRIFISRLFNINVGNSSDDLNNMAFYNLAKNEILELEKKIRDNYEEKLECKGETLAQMLCLDGCFIIEILRTLIVDVHGARNYYEPLFKRSKIVRTASDILLDILKLENQVPLIVLQKLLELELNSAEGVENMLKTMILSFFGYFKLFDYEIDENKWSWPQRDEEKVHLLGLLHILILFSERGRDEENIVVPYYHKRIAINDIANMPCAIKLRNAGIKFKRCNRGIKEINFDSNSGTIYLPCIIIQDSTEILFRNLIAFEMCNSSDHINYVACYVALMDQLIDTEEDVALLRKRGIVTNCLGSDKAVAEFFNDLGNDLGIRVSVNVGTAFNQLTFKVNEYYKKEWNGHFAKLRSEYFSSPWSIIALGATFVLLVLTLLQTVFTIKK